MHNTTWSWSDFSRAMVRLAECEPELEIEIRHEVDRILNDMLGDDMFGTEGQLDPRGDGRNQL